MKNILLLLGILVLCAACATPQEVRYDDLRRTPTTKVDVYRPGVEPSKPYTIIGEVAMEDFMGEEIQVQKRFIKRAQEIGADGVILADSKKSNFAFNPFGRSGDKAVWKAVMIVYK